MVKGFKKKKKNFFSSIKRHFCFNTHLQFFYFLEFPRFTRIFRGKRNKEEKRGLKANDIISFFMDSCVVSLCNIYNQRVKFCSHCTESVAIVSGNPLS